MNSPPLRVLLIEDDEDDHLLVKHFLLEVSPKGYELDWVKTYDEACVAIDRGGHDICLLDYRLGAHDGLELLREVNHKGCDIPIILLTGQGGYEVDLHAMRCGAADYLPKGEITASLLERSIRYAIEHKKAEWLLRGVCTELDKKVRERTEELTRANEQLSRVNRELRKEIVEREFAQKQVRSSLREKEVLLKEIHHRIKNNLQVISSLISLQRGLIEDERAIACFRETQNRIDSMAMIHEKLYLSQNLSRIHLSQYVRDIATNLFLSYGIDFSRIRLKLDVRDMTLGLDMAVPFGLILNELISNSLKHAFPERRTGLDGKGLEGEISVGLQGEEGKKYVLTVSDNGIGLPESLDWSGRTSLGVRLVSRLAEQLDGRIEVSGTEGTRVMVTLYEIRYRSRGLTYGRAEHPHSGR